MHSLKPEILLWISRYACAM